MKQADSFGKNSENNLGDPDGRLGACSVGSGVVPVTDLEAEAIAEVFRGAAQVPSMRLLCDDCGGEGREVLCYCGASACDGCAVVRCRDCEDSFLSRASTEAYRAGELRAAFLVDAIADNARQELSDVLRAVAADIRADAVRP